MLRRLMIVALLVVGLLAALPSGAMADEPVVRAILYYSESCSHCQVVLQEVLPSLQSQYGERLDVRLVEINEPGRYDELLRMEKAFGIPEEKATIPEVFAGERALLGEQEIREQLPALIETLLQEGGTAWPVGAEPAATPQPTRTPKACHVCDEEEAARQKSLAAVGPAIHLAYLYQPGCHECDRAHQDLEYLQSRYPQLAVHEYDINEHAALAEWLGERNGVPAGRRLTAPAVFVGGQALLGVEVTAARLEPVIQGYAEAGSEAYWLGQEGSTGAEASILERFRSFGVLTVGAAGLVDGLNPCAFATIVFFISYLSFMGRKGREVLLVGGMFALGVFVTYLGVGLGLLRALAALPFLPAISRYLYGLTAFLCLALAAGSLYDWLQMRRGRPEEMKLKLPVRLRRRINRIIREGANVRAFAGVALLTGAAVSLVELACTGQVYLPTIVFVLGVPALRARALLYLVLYNALFVLPLVVVFVLAYLGTTSERLGAFVNRHTGAIKLATAGLFLLLAGWMVSML